MPRKRRWALYLKTGLSHSTGAEAGSEWNSDWQSWDLPPWGPKVSPPTGPESYQEHLKRPMWGTELAPSWWSILRVTTSRSNYSYLQLYPSLHSGLVLIKLSRKEAWVQAGGEEAPKTRSQETVTEIPKVIFRVLPAVWNEILRRSDKGTSKCVQKMWPCVFTWVCVCRHIISSMGFVVCFLHNDYRVPCQ